MRRIEKRIRREGTYFQKYYDEYVVLNKKYRGGFFDILKEFEKIIEVIRRKY